MICDENNEIVYIWNDYINLLLREILGVDYSVDYWFEIEMGNFFVKFSVVNLIKFD